MPWMSLRCYFVVVGVSLFEICAMTVQEEAKKPLFQAKGFWDNLYRRTNSSESDWFQEWRNPMIARKGGQNLADVIMPHFTKLGSPCGLRLLHIGCGTSSMPQQMIHDGFVQQVCIDSSQVAMAVLAEKFANSTSGSYVESEEARPCGREPSIQFLALDARNTGFDNSTFDIIIDKGTLDAQVGGPNSTAEVEDTLAESLRLLRSNGLYVQISHSEKRGTMLEKCLDGTVRPWHAQPHGTKTPIAVLAPVAYTRKVDASDAPGHKKRKDTTYTYIYRKSQPSKDEF